MSRLRGLLGTLADLVRFGVEERRIAVVLLAVILLALGGFVLLAERSVIMPLIYTIF